MLSSIRHFDQRKYQNVSIERTSNPSPSANRATAPPTTMFGNQVYCHIRKKYWYPILFSIKHRIRQKKIGLERGLNSRNSGNSSDPIYCQEEN